MRLQETFELTDLGNAQRLVSRYGSIIRYVAGWCCWIVWDGRRWAKDDTGAVERFAKETVRQIYSEASATEDKEYRTALVRHGKSSESEPRLRAMVNLAKTEEKIVLRPIDLDTDRYLFNILEPISKWLSR
jgi:putative DNA primase/helicase